MGREAGNNWLAPVRLWRAGPSLLSNRRRIDMDRPTKPGAHPHVLGNTFPAPTPNQTMLEYVRSVHGLTDIRTAMTAYRLHSPTFDHNKFYRLAIKLNDLA